MNKIYLTLYCIVSSVCFGIEEPSMDVLISAETLAKKIKASAQEIERDYEDKNLTIIMIMKGSVCVAADLIRELKIPFMLEYVKASSYGQNGMKAKGLSISDLENLSIEGRDVLLVDDIFETGNTLLGVCKALETKNPKSIKTLVLLAKNIERKTTYRPDYVLFDIEDRFVIGYGLDYKELYRGLPDIRAFVDDKPPF